jgi:biofilm PGA synthesis protein PgaA
MFILPWRHAAISLPTCLLLALAMALPARARADTPESTATTASGGAVEGADPATAGQAVDRIYRLAQDDALGAANRIADAALRRFADSAPLWEAAGYVRRGAGDYAGALAAYQQAARLAPFSADAWRGQALMLRRLGALAPAVEVIRAHPELRADAELRAILAEQAALQMRYADSLEDRRERAARLQAVLDELDRLVEDAGGLLPAAAGGESAAFDRLQANVLLHREKEVIAQYEAMVAAAVRIPAYARVQAAIACARVGRTDGAIDILQPLVQEQPDDLDAQFELFYALVDRDRLESARALIDSLAGRLRAGADRDADLRARIAQAMARAYDEHPAQAVERLDRILDEAPFNADARAARAEVYLWRGWPRRARAEDRAVLAVAPRNRDARALQLQTDMELNDWPGARAHLAADTDEQALSERDEQQLASRLRWHQRPQFLLSSGYGTGSQSAVAANREWQLDAQGFGAVIHDRYRLFAHFHEVYTDVSPVSLWRTWGGLGAEAVWPGLSASCEMAAVSGEPVPAAVVHGSWQPADGARLALNLASSDPDTPARASANGIRLRTASLNAGYELNESTGIGADFGLGRFSDGNRQWSAALRLSQRLAASDRGRLVWNNMADVVADSLDARQAPYFDPSHATSQQTELRGEWLGWRDSALRRSQWHIVTLSLGRFQQSGYPTRPMAAVRYEQRWALSDHSGLGFELGHNRHPYDGHSEARTSVGLRYEGRF